MYLGEDISNFSIPNNGNVVICWYISADIHEKKALKVVESKLKYENVRWKPLNKTEDHTFSRKSYRPAIDMTEECNNDQVQ